MQPAEEGVDELGDFPAHLHELDEAGVAETIVAVDFYIFFEHPAAVLGVGAQSAHAHPDNVEGKITDAERVFVQIIDQEFRIGSHAVLFVIEHIRI